MKDRIVAMGGLECHLVEGAVTSRRAELVVVLCHGYGASALELAPLETELARQMPQLLGKVQFVLPVGPLSGDRFDTHAWWRHDFEELARLIQLRDVQGLRRYRPEGMSAARHKLMAFLDELVITLGIQRSQLVLGGFSQGAILASDVAFHLSSTPAGLCIFSGMLLNEREWRGLIPHRKGLRVLQVHGRDDELISYENALSLLEQMTLAGLRVEFFPHNQGHVIPESAVMRLGTFLSSLLNSALA